MTRQKLPDLTKIGGRQYCSIAYYLEMRRELGYGVSRQTFYQWLKPENKHLKERQKLKVRNYLGSIWVLCNWSEK